MRFRAGSMFFATVAVAWLCWALCDPHSVAQTLPSTTTQTALSIQTLQTQTLEGLGACQGASEHDGFIYLYGDANPGVIRQYILTDTNPPALQYCGLSIALTVGGKNLINHPTGLTWNAQFGTYLGNTITRTKKGTIFHLDWPRMLIDRTLDHAVLNTIDDDLAIQGCRPEFVRHGDQWLLATADYGHVNNAVRFYDPAKLASAKHTSDSGALVARRPCGPFVQQLHWIDSRSRLLLIENKIEGHRWRLVLADPWSAADFRPIPPYDDLPNLDELEGFTMLDPEHCLLVTSSRTNNATVGKISLPQ